MNQIWSEGSEHKTEDNCVFSNSCDRNRGTELAWLCGMFGRECWFTGTAEVSPFFLAL